MNMILLFLLLLKWSLFFLLTYLLTDIQSYYVIQEEVTAELDSAIFFIYEGFSESKERLRIQPAHLFHCTRSVMWCVQ